MPVRYGRSLSIVIINHNYGRFVETAIDSALAQSSPPHEVVVVDDGSTDNSRILIEAYGERVIPVFKEAGGHITAANAGFAACTGDVVIFLDADDYLYPHCAATVLEQWRDGASKIQYRLNTVDADGTDQNMPFPYFADDLTPEAVRKQSFQFGVYPWTVSSGNAFSRAFLLNLFPIDKQEIYRSPDGYINKMAPLFGDVYSLRDILGAYRVHGSNAWAQTGGGLAVDPIIRWLNFDLVLQTKFLSVAQQRQIAVVATGNQRSLQHLEHRLLVQRFAPDQMPYKNDSARSILSLGLKATLFNPNVGFAGRLFWMLWLWTLAFAPKPLIKNMFGTLRAQSGRSQISKLIVAASRGLARQS